MNGAAVSVIIVSRHRPDALRRCLLSLMQQTLAGFEVIVVACPAGIAVAQGFTVKRVAFDVANIAAARNLGLAQAAGQVVAFIDDDAAADPDWLARLVAPFDQRGVVAATGFVRGRNGMGFQWRAALVDAAGDDHPLAVALDHGFVTPAAPAGLAVKLWGTNFAARAAALRQIGGFDPALHFYLDDTDVALRLAPLGAVAVVPSAQVHHGFLAGPQRRANRVPKTLFDIAASTAVFRRRHAGGLGDYAPIRAHQSRRLWRMVARLRLSLLGRRRLLQTLDAGWQAGAARPLADLAPLPDPQVDPLPLPDTGPRVETVLAGRSWQADALHAQARAAVARGESVTLFLFAAGWRRHWHRFTDDGYWLQTGGLWGKSQRNQAVFRPFALKSRVSAELARIARLSLKK